VAFDHDPRPDHGVLVFALEADAAGQPRWRQLASQAGVLRAVSGADVMTRRGGRHSRGGPERMGVWLAKGPHGHPMRARQVEIGFPYEATHDLLKGHARINSESPADHGVGEPLDARPRYGLRDPGWPTGPA
jgi:hypothetical protein